MNEDICRWSVAQVLSWLKSTNDGQFESLVAAFREHQIYGDALLSLTNDILRDELGIGAYGARHALLKAIESLKERQSNMLKLQQIKSNLHRSSRHNPRSSLQRRQLPVAKYRKGSMSSICSKSSIKTKTSRTYCRGDSLLRDTMNSIDDNWENLNTMAKVGTIDASEYLKQVSYICSGFCCDVVHALLRPSLSYAR